MSESAFRGASAGATVFGIAVCPPAGAAAAQLAGGGTAAAASAGAVDTLVSVIPQIIGIEAAAEMLAQAGKAMLSKPPDGGDAAGGEEEGVYIQNGSSSTEIKAGKNFKDHFIRHKKLLENVTGKKYPKYKSHGQEFLNDLGKIIDDGTVKYVGKGTLKKGQPVANIYRGNGITVVIKENGEFVTILESGSGLDLGIEIIN